MPGAWARRPLIERVAQFKTKKILFIYGEFDWMDYKAGEKIMEMRKGIKLPFS